MRYNDCIIRMLVAALVFFVPVTFADDMTLQLDDDVEVILHDDHTWDYTKDSPAQMASDNSVVIDNGDIVQIKTDHTWSIIEQGDGESVTEVTEELGSAYSVGNAHGPDQYLANNTAMDAAVEHLAKQILAATGDTKLTVVRLSYCIEEEDKSIQLQEKLDKKIWRVQVNLSLDAEQIQTILRCARDE